MDYLNVIACFAVVMLHVTLRVFEPTVSKSWTLALFLQTIFIFAVPIFFMISGANLLGYRDRYDTKTFFKKRFKRTFTALFLASVLYYSLNCFFPQFFNLPPRHFSIIDFIGAFLSNDICSIYWFFYAVLMLYVMTPILSLIVKHRKLMQYTIAVGVVIVLIVPMLNNYLHLKNYTAYFFALPMFTFSLLYYLLGYYLTHHIRHDFSNVALIGFAVVSILAAFIFGYITNSGGLGVAGAAGGSPIYDNTMTGTSSISCFVLSTSIFLLFQKHELQFQNSNRIYRFVRLLAAATIGIYAIHFLVIWNMSTWSISNSSGVLGVLWEMCARPIMVYIISAAIIIPAQALQRHIKIIVISKRKRRFKALDG